MSEQWRFLIGDEAPTVITDHDPGDEHDPLHSWRYMRMVAARWLETAWLAPIHDDILDSYSISYIAMKFRVDEGPRRIYFGHDDG